MIFRFTSVIVDDIIAEGIQKVSDFFGFSESLAAVTLLAFANGAGDFITAMVASNSVGGVAYNIGALFGAGLFVCSLVVGICILQSKETMVFDSRIIYRDVSIYILAIVATFGIALTG